MGGTQLCTAQVLDKIIIKIGRNRIIQLSELDIQVAQARQQDPDFSDSSRCVLLHSMVLQKMLIEQADRDSVAVTDEDVEGQLDNRIRYFTQLYGSKEKLEQVSGKTVYQLKEDYRDVVREQMLAEKVQSQVLEHVKITPAEVDAFYKKIPVDSLPLFPASVEVGQIVIDPPVSAEMDDYAHKKIEDIKADIITGKLSFETAAGIYSEDPGSRDEGGRYEVKRNGQFVPEFENAAFKLQNGEISPIVKTKFGYHIIQMVNRKGDEAELRHILIKPTITSSDYNKAIAKLDSVRNLIVSGRISFPEAVGKFSTDEAAKRTGGMVMDPTTGNTELDVTRLDRDMILMLDTLKPGSVSAPHVYMNEMRERSCRIVYMRSRTEPHRANLKEDYGRIQDVALQQKKQKKIQDWVQQKAPTFYLWIAPEFRDCQILKDWVVREE
ncbi:peptidylprolyl isomerase [Nemorincola caseinilytica]|uniref:Peptidylprolyl isomerase n=2 Tax=Nemorincola caseinilytica TaxID=2054315 RepID=A0ABP8N6S1_9BACT